MMETCQSVTISLTIADVKRASTAIGIRQFVKFTLYLFTFAIITFTAISYYNSATLSYSNLIEMSLTLILAYLLIFPVCLFTSLITAIKNAKKNPELFTDILLEMTPDGISIRYQDGHSLLRWRFMRKVFLTKNYILIERVDRLTQIFPRRFFHDNGKNWYETIKHHISSKTP